MNKIKMAEQEIEKLQKMLEARDEKIKLLKRKNKELSDEIENYYYELMEDRTV